MRASAARDVTHGPAASAGAASVFTRLCKPSKNCRAGRAGGVLPSALGKLEAAARLGLAVLLALHHARVAGEEPAVLEHGAPVGLVPHQRLGESVPHGAGLAG